MNQYVDGFVLSIPTDKIDAYKAVATKAAAGWKDHGALEYRECIGDDLEVGDQVPFPAMRKPVPSSTMARRSKCVRWLICAARWPK